MEGVQAAITSRILETDQWRNREKEVRKPSSGWTYKNVIVLLFI
jgi:hypothetical protein